MSDEDLIKRSTERYAYGKFSVSRFCSPEAKVLVAWNSSEGRARLARSRYREAFFQLVGFYQPQINPLYCGVASAVIVLNAIRLPLDRGIDQPGVAIPIPGDPDGRKIEFRSFVQSTFLGPITEPVKARDVVEYRERNASGAFRPGLSLDELRGMLEAYGARVSLSFASEAESVDKGAHNFRECLMEKLRANGQFLIAHFRSDLIGGIPRGHISPLAAYDEKSDSVLVLDVAGHKGPWYWAPVPHLYHAMSATYDTQPKGGGYLVVS